MKSHSPNAAQPALAIERWYVGARLANVLLGLWLLASAFLWEHVDTSRRNTWVVGALICASGLVALRKSAARWVNMALAGWLFVSSVLLYRPLRTDALEQFARGRGGFGIVAGHARRQARPPPLCSSEDVSGGAAPLTSL
jgi:hypothetical protein